MVLPKQAAGGLGLTCTLGAAFAGFRLALRIHCVNTIARGFVPLAAGFPAGVVGHIPATTLKVKAVQRHEFFHVPLAVRAIS